MSWRAFIGAIKVECFLVPGHAWGHMVYLIGGAYLFTGDTLWLGPDRDAERIVRELGQDISGRAMYRLQYMWINCVIRQYSLAWEITEYLKKTPFNQIGFHPSEGVVFTAGGLFYYFEKEQVRRLLCAMAERFPGGMITVDAVNSLGLKGVNAEVKLAGNNSTKSFFSVERPR